MTFSTSLRCFAAMLLSGGLLMAQECVILKRMGPADQITSHMYSFGIRGKQFQFVEGQLPKGIKFHGRLTDHDVRLLQDAGSKVVIIEPKFTGADLAEARKGCISNPSSPTVVSGAPTAPISPAPVTGEDAPPKAQASAAHQSTEIIASPNTPDNSQGAPARLPAVRPAVLSVVDHQPVAPSDATTSSALGKNLATATAGTASITSSPEGADIFIDSVGRGRAPVILQLPAGKHSIQLVLSGYKDWMSDVDVKASSVVNVTATFEK